MQRTRDTLPSLKPFLALALTIVVAGAVFRYFASPSSATQKHEDGFLPNLNSQTNGALSAPKPGQASGTQTFTNAKSFHPLIVSTDTNGRPRLRLERLTEARVRVSIHTVSVAFVLAVLFSWMIAGILIWKMAEDNARGLRTFVSLLLPAMAAGAMGCWYSHNRGLFLGFTVAIHGALSAMAESLPQLDWLVLCHGLGLGCALAFCTVSAWIITRADGNCASEGNSAKALPLGTYLNAILYTGAAVLAMCVLFEISFYDWLAVHYVSDELQYKAFKSLSDGFLVATGLIGSLFLASYYVPAVMALNQMPGAQRINFLAGLKSAFAVTAPLLVGSLPRIMELLGAGA